MIEIGYYRYSSNFESRQVVHVILSNDIQTSIVTYDHTGTKCAELTLNTDYVKTNIGAKISEKEFKQWQIKMKLKREMAPLLFSERYGFK